MLKNPGEPTPSSGLAGTSFGGRVVRTVVGTSASGAKLKYEGLKVREVVNSVTCNVT